MKREQSMKRQAQNEEHMASLRQSETCEQSMKRQACVAAVECETCIYTQPVYRNFVYSVPLCVWKVLGTCETTHGVYEFRRGFCTLVLSFTNVIATLTITLRDRQYVQFYRCQRDSSRHRTVNFVMNNGRLVF